MIYIVMGEAGEYSDRDEWPVCYFEDEDQAKALVEYLDAKVKGLYALTRRETPEHFQIDPDEMARRMGAAWGREVPPWGLYDPPRYYLTEVPAASDLELP
jgi:hypothetical protein